MPSKMERVRNMGRLRKRRRTIWTKQRPNFHSSKFWATEKNVCHVARMHGNKFTLIVAEGQMEWNKKHRVKRKPKAIHSETGQ